MTVLDESLVGKTSEVKTFEVEKGHIRFFAEAVGDDHPLYRDEAYAAGTRLKGIIAPPTFPTVFRTGGAALLEDIEGFELERVLHGGQEFEFERPLRPGDRLWVQSEVVRVRQTRGQSGKMTLITIESTARDINELLVVTGRSTIIYQDER